MPVLLLLLLGGAGAVYVATKKKAPPETSLLEEGKSLQRASTEAQIVQDQWYRVTAEVPTNPALDAAVQELVATGQDPHEALKTVLRLKLEELGFKDTLLETQNPAYGGTSPSGSPEWSFITEGATSGPLLPSDGILRITDIIEVDTPPEALPHADSPKDLDIGIPYVDAKAVATALAYEGSPTNLNAFAATLADDYPIAAGLLRAKANLTNLQSKLMAEKRGQVSARALLQTRTVAVQNQTAMNQPSAFELLRQFSVKTSGSDVTEDEGAPGLPGVKPRLLRVLRAAKLRQIKREKGIPRTAGFDLSDIGDTASNVGDTLKDATSSLGDAVSDAWDKYGGFVEILGGWVPGALIWQIETGAKLLDGVASDKNLLDIMGEQTIRVAKAAKAAAPAIALVPGIGAGVATMIDVSCGLALGEPMDQIALDIAADQVPGGAVAKAAFDVAKSAGSDLIAGKDWSTIALNAARTAAVDGARAAGIPDGDVAAAVLFDAGLALARGKSLQEAGFSGLFAFTKGNDILNKGAYFAKAMVVAAQTGKDMKDVLADELVHDLGYLVQTQGPGILNNQLRPLLGKIEEDTSLLQNMPAELAQKMGVNETVANAALACAKTIAPGTVILDPDLTRRFLSSPPTRVPSGAIALVAEVMRPNALYEATQSQLAAMNRFNQIQIEARNGNQTSMIAQMTLHHAQVLLERQKWVDRYEALREQHDLQTLSARPPS